MKTCMFCSIEAEMLFSHLTHDSGQLCIECYMKLHGSCGVCMQSLISDLGEHSAKGSAKYLNTGDKTILLCKDCLSLVQQEFPHMF